MALQLVPVSYGGHWSASYAGAGVVSTERSLLSAGIMFSQASFFLNVACSSGIVTIHAWEEELTNLDQHNVGIYILYYFGKNFWMASIVHGSFISHRDGLCCSVSLVMVGFVFLRK